MGATAPSQAMPAPGPGPVAGIPPAVPRNRNWLIVTLAVVIVIGLVLAGLVSTGVVPLFKKSPPPTYPTYTQASSLARAAANATNGGAWGVVLGVGLNSRGSLARPFVGNNGDNFCSFPPLRGSTLVTIPAIMGNVASGQSAYWAFALRNSTGSILGVSVSNDTAAVFGTGNYRCRIAFAADNSVVPPMVIDSVRAAAIANGAGGTAFLQSHLAANVTMQVQGNFSFLNMNTRATWTVAYSNCPVDVNGAGTSGSPNSTLLVTIDALSGTVQQSLNVSGVCPVPFGGPVAGSAPLSSALSLGASVDYSGTDFQIPGCVSLSCNFFNFTLNTAGANLLLGDLAFGVTTPTGAAASVTGGVALVNVIGLVVGFYSFQSGNWSSLANLDLQVSTMYVLSLFETSGPPLVGDFLIAAGSPGFTGTVRAAIS